MSQATGAHPDPATLAALLEGEPRGETPRRPIRGVAIDSRRVQPGDLFFALPGRQTDGHRFVAEALAAGAVLAVTRRDWRPREGGDALPEGAAPEGPILAVADPLRALQRLAAWHERPTEHPPPATSPRGSGLQAAARSRSSMILWVSAPF